MPRSRTACYVLVFGLFLGAPVKARAQASPACKADAVSQCSQQCGDSGACIFGCEVGQFGTVDQCTFDCNGLGAQCVTSCLQTIEDIAICAQPPDAFQVNYVSNLQAGDSSINISNTGSSGQNICASLYVFDPSEEMVSCCSCPITPNALQSLSVQGDLISNTLSPSTPQSVVIKILASAPGRNGTCDPTASFAGLNAGLRAWGTNLHLLPGSPSVYGVTETDFVSGGLSLAELNHLTSFCGFINANGSGFGLCKSCRTGGLGGAKN